MSDGNTQQEVNNNSSNLTFKKPFFLKSRPAFLAILTFLIFGSLFGLLAYQRFEIIRDVSEAQTHHVLYQVKEKLHELLEQGIATTRTLSYFIEKDGDVKEFDSVASHILAVSKNIDALELVPGGIIQKIYPLKGNEAVLGYDVLNDPTRSSEAKRAIKDKSFFYAGPMQLKQGGIGVVGRMPIFINDRFWGFSAVVIKLPQLLKAAGIDSLIAKGYYFQLSKINPDSHLEESFIKDSQKPGTGNILSVSMPNEEWKLSAKSTQDGQRYVDFYLLALLLFLFSILLSVLVFSAAQRPEKLDRLIQLRTADVVKKEKKYRSLIEQASDGIVIIDNYGRIAEVNKSAGKITGYHESEILGHELNDFLLVEGVNSQPLRTHELTDGASLIYERKIQRKDGTIIDVEVNSKMADNDTFIGFIRDITERKQSELLLGQSEIKYRSLFTQASDGIMITNLAGIILEVNKSICLMGGYDINEMIGHHATEFMPEEDVTKKPLRIDDLISGKTLMYERRMQKKDGTVIDVEINSKMTITKTLIGFIRDITERKSAAAELKKSIEQYELVAKATNDAIWDYDVENDIADGNDNLYLIYGLKKGIDKLNYQLLLSRTHPEDREILASVFLNAITNRYETLEKQFRFQIPDGSYRHIFDRSCFKYDEKGQLVRILGVMQDVTDRIKNEQTLLLEKELSDSLINNLPGIFYIYDKSGKFIRWNKNFERVTGYNAEEIRQMHPLDFYDDEVKKIIAERIESNFIRETPGIELNLVIKTKQKIPYYYNSHAIRYEDQPCIMGMAIDVSDRKIIERELVRSNRQLEQKASELKHSYAELERFAYIVSHDLQEPLRMVSSFLKLLEQKYKSQLDEKGEKYIHFAVDGADRMKQLIMDLLEYSRTGTNSDRPADTNIQEVVEDVLNVLKNSIMEQGATVEVGKLPVLPDTSRILMFQLFQNLVSNALKYNGQIAPVIKIDVEDEDHQWVFSVADNGIGIEPQYAEKIFVIFQRLHGKDEYSGTGIGLAICKKIIDRIGGKIWVKSSGIGGSTFYFSVPKPLSLASN